MLLYLTASVFLLCPLLLSFHPVLRHRDSSQSCQWVCFSLDTLVLSSFILLVSGPDVEAVGSARWPGIGSSVTESSARVALGMITVSLGCCSFLDEEIHQPGSSFAQTPWLRKGALRQATFILNLRGC